MTFLHRLAHRIARLRTPLQILAVVAAACSQGDRADFLSPFANPNKEILKSVQIDPQNAATPLGTPVQFTAKGLTGSGEPIAIEIEWSAEGGNISPEGVYYPGAAGPFRVIARAHQDPGIADTATVAVWQNATDPVGLVIRPDSVTVQQGDTLGFAADLNLANGVQAGGAIVTWSTSGGQVDNSGRFTSLEAGTYTVAATTSDGLQGSATVFVVAAAAVGAPTVTSLTLSPKLIALAPGETQFFAVSAVWSNGGTKMPALTWTGSGGSIATHGLNKVGSVYTAGSNAGTYRVIVSGGGKADTAIVVISAPTAATLASLTVSPKPVSLPVGSNQQFSVSATWSDGSTTLPSIAWSATGGSISSSGSYAAGATAGTFRVVAEGGGRADTAVVTLTPPTPPSLTALGISPKDVTLGSGQTQQFVVSAVWSDGTTVPPQASWSATGGTMSSTGLYAAGTTAGIYRAIVSGGGRADTATVTVTAPPVLQSLVLNPGLVSLAPGGSQQFSVAASWSNGSTALPTVIWTATGGTVSSSGYYTAGSAAGIYRVIASGDGKADTSAVTINSASGPTLTRITLGPEAMTLTPGENQFFAATAQWSDGSTTVPTLSWSATGGSVSTAGLSSPGGVYTAGATPGSYRVIAAGEGKADTATVTISGSGGTATLTELTIAPKPVSLSTGATQQFSVGATWSDGSTTLPSIAWSATGGTVSSSGKFAAGATAGTFRVVAAGGGKADTAVVTLVTPVVTRFLLTPASATVAVGASQQFSSQATWSDGATRPFSVTYTATGGTISVGGLYTAGPLLGTFSVIASCACGKADTSSVLVAASTTPTVTNISVSPKPASLFTGGTQQFTAAAQWSNGSTTLPTLTWSATGGTVSSTGLYTAGNTAGTYRVIVAGGGNADTSSVTLSAPPQGQPVGWMANKPGNYVVVTEIDFSQAVPTGAPTERQIMGSDGWHVIYDEVETGGGGSNFSLVTDPTAPRSPNSVWRQQFPAGSYGGGVVGSGPGTGFGNVIRSLSASQQFYLCFAVKWDANYEWHPVADKFLEVTPGDILVPSQESGRWLGVDILNGANSAWLVPQVNTPIERGVWHVIELLIQRGNPGTVKLWMDGVLRTSYSNINIPLASGWQEFWLVGFRGGGGEIKTRDSYQWFDHLTIATP